MLELHDIRKSFHGKEVLKGVSLSVETGDVLALIGPSGSGKTTLLRCANFLERADSGTMVFDGREYDLSRIRRPEIAAIRRETGFVFQNYNLFANRTALGNVTEGLIAGRGIPRDEAVARARQALDRVGMTGWEDHHPNQPSGGQQQRVAIARAMALEPKIIFFYEPTSALDPELIGEVLAVMRDLASSGMTMMVVTHEMSFARHVSNRVIFMEDGQIVEDRKSKQFFKNPKSPRAAQFLEAIRER